MPDHAQYASVSDVEEAASHWDSRVLQCRTYGHHWQPYTASFNSIYRYYRTIQVCPECGAERHRELDQHGHTIRSWYEYPEGYLLKGLGRIIGDARDALALATIKRTFKIKNTKDQKDRPHWLDKESA